MDTQAFKYMVTLIVSIFFVGYLLVLAHEAPASMAHKNSASKWLEWLREDGNRNSSYIGYVREHLEEGGLSLADIGTNEEEMERLGSAVADA